MNAAIAAAFDRQAGFCAAFDAPLYAELCRRSADDIRAGGKVAAALATFTGDPAAGSLPLRLLGAVHDRVLRGRAPALARHYPSTGGAPRWPEAWDAFVAAVVDLGNDLRPWLQRPPQTNEVARSCAMFLGLATIAGRCGPRMHLLELGASGGLLQRCDRYGYRFGDVVAGDARSSLQLVPEWRGPSPAVPAFELASRAACDRQPIDLGDADQRARLAAYVWSDHARRATQLRAALELAAREPIAVDTAEAGAWLERKLAAPLPPGATVVFHSSVRDYLTAAERARIDGALAAAGARATATASLHHLQWENPPKERDHELLLRSWPGDTTALLARGQPHCSWIEWLGPRADQPIRR